jgi:hypothetical protein
MSATNAQFAYKDGPATNAVNAPSNVKWKPLPGSQTLAMSCPANIIVYHGTRGPGKTDSQLMRFRRRVGLGYGRHWRGIIFDREYKNLDDLVSKSQRWFPEMPDEQGRLPRFLSSKSDYRWVWSSGEELLFRAIKKESDYWGYHGQEFPFIGWNELTKYPTDTLFESLMSCNRTSFRPEDYPIYNQDTDSWEYLPELTLEVFATCNPYGAGHNWVKKRFINAAPMGKIQVKTMNVFNPRTQRKEDIVKTQVHLFGSYRENIYLPPEYIAELSSITDPNKRKAWLQGDWDVLAGGMFDDMWDSLHNVVKPFGIPSSWRIDRSFDWGSSKPFSVGWWAESDGSDVMMPDGTWRSTVRGDLFRIAEWYGWNGKSNQGLMMLASDVAAGIVERELALGIHGRVQPGPADNAIWDVENGNSIAVDMRKPVTIKKGPFAGKGPLAGGKWPGVEWGRSDKSAGSRKAGWEKMRKYMRYARPNYLLDANGQPLSRIPREHPGLFVFNTCTMFIDLVPVLPRDEVDQDDVDTESEDHIGDEARYRVLATGMGARMGKTKGT